MEDESISGTFVHRNQKHQIRILMITLMLAVSTGLHSGWPTPAIPRLLHNDMGFNISEKLVSYMVMIYPLSYTLADPVTALTLDFFGRKTFIWMLGVLELLAWIVIAESNGIAMLFGGRFLAGFAEGATYISLPIYICEITEANVRGRSGMCYTSAFIFGIFLINCYGSYIPLRLSAFISLYVPIFFLLAFIWMPESPYFLLMNGRTEQARSVLKILRGRDDVDTELDRLSTAIRRQVSEPGGLKSVFLVKSNRRAFFIMIGLRTLQQLSGGWAIVYYNQIIFREAHGSLSYTLSSIIFDATMVLVSFSGVILIDRCGRRPLLLSSCIGTLFCLLLQAIYFTLKRLKYDLLYWKWVPLTGMIMYTTARGVGIMSIPSLMSAELFSTNIKVKAIGIINVYTATCIGITSKLFQVLGERYGMHVPFYLFVFCTIIGIVFIYYFIPETKGRTLEEIQERLRGEYQENNNTN